MKPGRFTIRTGEESYEVEITADGRAQVNGADEAATIEPVGPGAYRVHGKDRSAIVFVAGPPAARQVFLEGRVYDVEVLPEGAATRKRGTAHRETLSAPMPATVTAIMVAPGQAVRRGDTLLKLEAMKMELPLRAPRDGTVGGIHCRVGELVQPGVHLLELA